MEPESTDKSLNDDDVASTGRKLSTNQPRGGVVEPEDGTL